MDSAVTLGASLLNVQQQCCVQKGMGVEVPLCNLNNTGLQNHGLRHCNAHHKSTLATPTCAALTKMFVNCKICSTCTCYLARTFIVAPRQPAPKMLASLSNRLQAYVGYLG